MEGREFDEEGVVTQNSFLVDGERNIRGGGAGDYSDGVPSCFVDPVPDLRAEVRLGEVSFLEEDESSDVWMTRQDITSGVEVHTNVERDRIRG